MKKRLNQFIMASMALIAAGLSFNSLAADGYKPPVSFPKHITTYTIKSDGSYEVIVEMSERIETEAGISLSGDANITYIPRLEKVQILDAYTILPNGKHIKVTKTNIRTTDDELDRGGASYSDAKHKIIIFPEVAVGGEVYWKYKKVVHAPDFQNQFEYIKFVSPQFKQEESEVNFNYDPGIDIKFDSNGFEGGRLPDRKGMHRYSFVRKQETALPPEPDSIDESDYAPFVQATTYPNYEALGAAYQSKAKPKVKVTPAIRKLAADLTAGVEDKKAQTRLLYGWVAKNIRYVASYMGNGGFVPHDSQTILDNKWGDCKDHVVLLEALLAAKGICSVS